MTMGQKIRPRIGVVGPTFPHRGGIVEHTTELVKRMDRTGMLAVFAPWERYRPRLRSPNEKARGTAGSEADVSRVPGLRWTRPLSWTRTGDAIGQRAEHLLFVLSSPAQLPALLTMRSAFRRRRPEGRAALIVHNVIPHNAGPVGRILACSVLHSQFSMLVHSDAQAELARRHGAPSDDVRVAYLPYHGPAHDSYGAPGPTRPRDRPDTDGLRLLFLGFVRRYKGLDVLLEALHHASRPHSLLVMGEFWQAPELFRRRIASLRLQGRVELRPGYASDSEVEQALRSTDALVLPYLSGTASQLPRIAFAAGVPVIATAVGDFPEQVRHGVDGMIVPPADPLALALALDAVANPDRLEGLRALIRPPLVDSEWENYLDAIDRLLAV